MRQLLKLFGDRRGVAAALFALMLPPVLLATGAAVDFARMGMLKTSLQSVADGAALAGASALCLSNGQQDASIAAQGYFAKEAIPLQRGAQVVLTSAKPVSSIEVTVTATATLNNPLMGPFSALIGQAGMNETVSVTSSAEGPAYTIQATATGGFNSTSSDGDTIYFYVVPSNGSLPSKTAMKELFTDDPTVDPNWQTDNAKAKTVSVGGNDLIGFALQNNVGARYNYGTNLHGSPPGTLNMFYSTLPVPSQAAYTPSQQGTFYTGQQVTQRYGWRQQTSCQFSPITGIVNDWLQNQGPNAAPSQQSTCNAHPCTEMSGNNVLENNLLIGNACSTPTSATMTCLQLYNNPQSFAWNDMSGGSFDDYNYQDAVYTVQCIPSGGLNQPNSVILVN